MKNIYVLESFTGIQFTFHINVKFLLYFTTGAENFYVKL